MNDPLPHRLTSECEEARTKLERAEVQRRADAELVGAMEDKVREIELAGVGGGGGGTLDSDLNGATL